MEKQPTQEEAFMKELGRRLKAARQAEGLSLQAVADRLSLKARATVGHWETGLNPIDIGRLWRLARLYKTTVLALVSEDMTPDEFVALTRRQLEKAAGTPQSGKRSGESSPQPRRRASR